MTMKHIETWKRVIDWPDYSVSSLGRIRRDTYYATTKIGYILKPIINHRGYAQINICGSGKRKTVFVHKIVAEAFLGLRKNKYGVNHKDCNKTNNRVDNLEWCTPKENIRHAFSNGRFRKLTTWAWGFKCCRVCKTTTLTHASRGLCINCYRRKGVV